MFFDLNYKTERDPIEVGLLFSYTNTIHALKILQ